MIVFPAVAAAVALVCAAITGWDALERPRPERVAWTTAFFVFALAASVEVAGGVFGWNATLTRVYYLAGAVLVVGLLALGELYLLLPQRLPVMTPGLVLLVVAIAVTSVWSAPVDTAKLQTHGWEAIERGPFLIALAAGINAIGTLVLAGGALYSAWRLRDSGASKRRAFGCLFIAIGTIIVASGGTLTRFGHREYLYIAMALGIVIIFGGVLFTRGGAARRGAGLNEANSSSTAVEQAGRAPLVALPVRRAAQRKTIGLGAGVEFIVRNILPLPDEAIANLCLKWSASAFDGDTLSRDQARQVWAVRLALPEESRARFDGLPLAVQAQLVELRTEVWIDSGSTLTRQRGA